MDNTPMQRPTLENVRIRSPRDALVVFHGVALNILPLITRRLDIEERRAIAAGNVYVWEERGVNTETVGLGMERWYVDHLFRWEQMIYILLLGRMGWDGDQVVRVKFIRSGCGLTMVLYRRS